MYSSIKSIQILLSLLKEYGIENIVLSPGGSDIPLIHSIESDEFFHCYSVVDERSAAYYAMGVAQMSGKPCACVCTSGTAVCNYLPGLTEAYYQEVPVLAITADKNPIYQNQLETQKIRQVGIFSGVIKYEVELPVVKTDEDAWLCNRLVNEALLSLSHHGHGPVHINIPIVESTNTYDCQVLPIERKINIEMPDKELFIKLKNELDNKKVMVVVGQNIVLSDEDKNNMERFFDCVNCFFAVEHISNCHIIGTIDTYRITETLGSASLDSYIPDVVISIGNNLAAYQLKPLLRKHYKKIDNWLIWERGEVRDAYKSLTKIIECSPSKFFDEMTKSFLNNVSKNSHEYYYSWKKLEDNIIWKEMGFSNFYAIEKVSKVIPSGSIVHTAILNSTRLLQFFDLPKDTICFSNVGALGIDGCFSTFAGQAVCTDKLAYLIIGDLSFFYDMNAAGLRSIGANVRVILINNGGGSEFQFFWGKKQISTIDNYICAEHEKVAAGWIKSLGYDYYMASSKEELNEIIDKFGEPSKRPMFLEVITDMEDDAEKTKDFYYSLKDTVSSDGKIKKLVKSFYQSRRINKIRKIFNLIKEK